MRTSYYFGGMVGFVLMSLMGLLGCSDDDESKVVTSIPPSINLEVSDVTRTTASFSISSSDATDYAYVILPDAEKIADAKTLFKEGTAGIFEKDSQTAKITLTDLTGDSNYMLYAAVRTINPFVYSEILSQPIDTHKPYSGMISLESVGTTSYVSSG